LAKRKNGKEKYLNKLLDVRLKQEAAEFRDLSAAMQRELKHLPALKRPGKDASKRAVKAYEKAKAEQAAFKKETNALLGAKPTRETVANSTEWKRLMSDLKSKSKSARGRKAKALVQLGMRDSSWSWAVGETQDNT